MYWILGSAPHYGHFQPWAGQMKIVLIISVISPTNTLVTGYDIIAFWVSRMIFQSLEFTGKRPFENVLIHGLIRDEQGRKMSKSLGNGIDPMEVIEKYGADALRWFLSNGSAPGQDVRFSYEKWMLLGTSSTRFGMRPVLS